MAAVLAAGLIATGSGAVIAAGGGSASKGSSGKAQYCPPSSPGAGKPKNQLTGLVETAKTAKDGKGGNKCGQR